MTTIGIDLAALAYSTAWRHALPDGASRGSPNGASAAGVTTARSAAMTANGGPDLPTLQKSGAEQLVRYYGQSVPLAAISAAQSSDAAL